ncbi:unnamed protein product [Mytilus edulis]|uniref:CIDE-N domain-containing protein n=1 Tax=Mytilus edulis TaxID=6550 RepID=A0A8S3SDD7_MYTED|nr:unnamed protein product [Mytilus edulis]
MDPSNTIAACALKRNTDFLKLKKFATLPYSLSKHHQLYMCMKQSGTKCERSCNFLYDGDVVVNGKEINFSAEYPNLTIEMATVSQKNVQDEWPMYKTESVTIHGLHYKVGCAVVLQYESDIPIFGLIKDIIVYDKDKYFIIQNTTCPALVWDSTRKVKKMVMASTVAELKDKGCSKLSMERSRLQTVVLDIDGTEVEDDGILLLMEKEPMVFLGPNEEWVPQEKSVTSDKHVLPSSSTIKPSGSSTINIDVDTDRDDAVHPSAIIIDHVNNQEGAADFKISCSFEFAVRFGDKKLKEVSQSIKTVVATTFKMMGITNDQLTEGPETMTEVIKYLEEATKFDRSGKGRDGHFSSIIKIYENIEDDDVKNKLKSKEMTPPHLVIFKSESKKLAIYIVGDSIHITCQGSSVTSAITQLLAIYYVFDIDYPKCYAMVLGLLQIFVMNEAFTYETSKNLSFCKEI